MSKIHSTLHQVALFLLFTVIVGGCEYITPKPLTPIYAIKGEELNFVKTIYDVNDPNKIVCYKICNDSNNTGVYLSKRVLRQIFKVEIK